MKCFKHIFKEQIGEIYNELILSIEIRILYILYKGLDNR